MVSARGGGGGATYTGSGAHAANEQPATMAKTRRRCVMHAPSVVSRCLLLLLLLLLLVVAALLLLLALALGPAFRAALLALHLLVLSFFLALPALRLPV